MPVISPELKTLAEEFRDTFIELVELDDERNLSEQTVTRTEEFKAMWTGWKPLLLSAIDTSGQDAHAELQILIGNSAGSSNVGIFHTDMTNAAFLPNSINYPVKDSHGLTEHVIELSPSKSSAGFSIFARDREPSSITRRLLVLADANPPETIAVENPDDLEGYVLHPGNIIPGKYLFGTSGNPDESMSGRWSNWTQALPWSFIDLSETFHRAPTESSHRNMLIRLSIYEAPEREGLIFVAPKVKYYN